MSAQREQKVRSAEQQGRSALLLNTLIVGLLLGASLGPALFLAVRHLELSGDQLFAFVVGVFVTFGVCLVIAGISALLIVPRIFSSARGTLAAMVDDLTQASRAHSEGDSAKALDHFGRAVGEGAAWYSIGATRRFVAQAALGLLISFGGVLGAVLLLSQNSLLRDQNLMIKSQLGLLKEQNNKIDEQLRLLVDQNVKIDQQLKLLVDQNVKIDQQTMVADAQKRGAYATEMFSILQEIAKGDRADGEVPKELVTRIAVLTSTAAPYIYMDFRREDAGSEPRPIRRALSPERGQLIVALLRMKVKLSALAAGGARFDSSDLRDTDMRGADLSSINLSGSDFSFAHLGGALFVDTFLTGAVIKRARAREADFTRAVFNKTEIEDSDFERAIFNQTGFLFVTIKGGNFTNTSFVGNEGITRLEFENVKVGRWGALPKGLPWPREIQDSHKDRSTSESSIEVNHVFWPRGYPR